MKKRHHFTLVELVVVTVPLLAAMLLPALSAARERARASNCVANLKRIAVEEMMYASDNCNYRVTPTGFTGEYIGNQIDPVGTRRVKDTFYGNYPAAKLILQGYIGADYNGGITAGNKVVFKCPSDVSYSENNTRISYYDAVFAEDKPQAAARYNFNKVKAPGKLAIWFDQHNNLGNAFSNHPNMLNIAWMDGHVEGKLLPENKVFSIETQDSDGWQFLDK